jgi:phage gpG-like protein
LITPTIHFLDRDRGWKKAIIESAKKGYVEVGIRAEKSTRRPDPDFGDMGMTNVWLAAIHEFGTTIITSGGKTIKIPQRSFIRATIDSELNTYRKIAKNLSRRIFEAKMTVESALKLLGLKVSSDMRSKIESGIPPILSSVTVIRKGSSKQLIDTGQLKQSITSKVRMG